MTDSDPSDDVQEWLDKPLEHVTPDSITTHLEVPRDFDGEIRGAVPIEELEALVREWRSQGYQLNTEGTLAKRAVDSCADELQEILDRYE